MTEIVWLNCTDSSTVARYIRTHATLRKLRLLLVGSCRQEFREWLPEKCVEILTIAEQYADGLVNESKLTEARHLAENLVDWYEGLLQSLRDEFYDQPPHGDEALISEIEDDVMRELRRRQIIHAATISARGATFPNEWLIDGLPRTIIAIEPPYESNCRIEIFGNPFRPIAIDPRWLTSTVVELTSAIYDERAWERMPILADALMDAGCDKHEIIAHCRTDGAHVLGCWVVDLLLAKK